MPASDHSPEAKHLHCTETGKTTPRLTCETACHLMRACFRRVAGLALVLRGLYRRLRLSLSSLLALGRLAALNRSRLSSSACSWRCMVSWRTLLSQRRSCGSLPGQQLPLLGWLLLGWGRLLHQDNATPEHLQLWSAKSSMCSCGSCPQARKQRLMWHASFCNR